MYVRACARACVCASVRASGCVRMRACMCLQEALGGEAEQTRFVQVLCTLGPLGGRVVNGAQAELGCIAPIVKQPPLDKACETLLLHKAEEWRALLHVRIEDNQVILRTRDRRIQVLKLLAKQCMLPLIELQLAECADLFLVVGVADPRQLVATVLFVGMAHVVECSPLLTGLGVRKEVDEEHLLSSIDAVCNMHNIHR